MSSHTVSNPDVAAMSPAEAEEYVHALDRERRIVEARIATFVHLVGQTGLFAADKHRTPKAWGKAACNWSGSEAAKFVKVATMLATFDSAASLAAQGGFGVAQMHALASLVANPRVKEHLSLGEELLVGQAAELDYDDYVCLLANWERVADEDGAHHDSERAHRNRKASGSVVGDQFFLDAVCGLAQGLQMKEILEAFAKSEWMADWEAGLAIHGDAMAANLMDRTDPQRRMDALLAIFLKAAGGDTEATGSGFTINLTVGLPAFEHHLAKAMGQHPAPLDPNDPNNKCETSDGTPLDPSDMIVAATIGNVRRIVLDSTGVVVNMGRKQRLFTGPLRDAVLMHSRWCVCPGCTRPAARCEADHVLPWANAGPTNSRNGGPLCGHHNRWKATGYRTWRDQDGHWHHYRPDGTEIGWRGECTRADEQVLPCPQPASERRTGPPRRPSPPGHYQVRTAGLCCSASLVRRWTQMPVSRPMSSPSSPSSRPMGAGAGGACPKVGLSQRAMCSAPSCSARHRTGSSWPASPTMIRPHRPPRTHRSRRWTSSPGRSRWA